MNHKSKQAPKQTDGGKTDTRTSRRPTSSSKPRGKGKPKEKDYSEKTGYPAAAGSNNPAWHSPDSNILERAANLSWSYQSGELVDTGALGSGTSKAAQAGIFVVKEKIAFGGLGLVSPSVRYADFAQPATVAANTLLSEMRSRTRVRNTYDAPDVAMLMLAMANIYGGIYLAKRLVGTCKSFAYANDYLPRVLFQAQGFDYEWFRKNMYNFTSELNVIISEINKVYVPNRMHIFELFAERWSNYYTEGKEIRDQIYLFTPGILSAIDYLPATDWASSLVPVMVFPGKWNSTTDLTQVQYDASSLWTGEDLLNCLKFMLSRVINHDSTADITGDMMNAFGDGERFTLPECDPSLICVPVENYEILEVIHNSKMSIAVWDAFATYDGSTPSTLFRTIQLPSSNEIGEFDCYQIAASRKPLCQAELMLQYLDVHEAPNPYKTMEITRCRNDVVTVATESGTDYAQISAGAELVLSLECWAITTTGPAVTQMTNLIGYTTASWYLILSRRAPFHYAPLLLPVNGSTGEGINDIWYLGETDIYTRMPHSIQKEIDRVSLLTLMGAYNNLS